MKKAILVTGASGFVGQILCTELHHCGWPVRAALRKSLPAHSASEQIIVDKIDGQSDWTAALQDVEVVIHLAARVHVMRETSTDPLAEFRKVNVQGTKNLARQAARAGVKRLVYVSSIKVNGETTDGRQSYTERDMPSPQDPYGVSKWEAEQALHHVAQETGLEVVIVRPPLVYGPGVKGNFISLLSALNRGIPLPLAGADNARSLVYVGNLVDALIGCAIHPAAAGQTYLVSDGETVSTSELVRRLAEAMGVPVRLFPFPPSLLRLAGALAGKSGQIERLLGSLQVDSGKIRRELNWHPPYSLQQGLQATADWYRSTRL
jgi:nucleoside-diphosphate-sugar epimerase